MTTVRKKNAVRSQYAKLAPDYDQRWSRYVEATAEATLARVDDAEGRLIDVVDVGCGTGVLLAKIVDRFPGVAATGVDASREMLKVAHARLPVRVKLLEAWAEQLPFADESFDMLASCNMFHFIEEPQAALREFLRVLRPGGALVITDWCDDYLTCKLCDLYLRLVDPSHRRAYGAAECREMLAATAAQAIRVERYRLTWLWGMMTATAQKAAA